MRAHSLVRALVELTALAGSRAFLLVLLFYSRFRRARSFEQLRSRSQRQVLYEQPFRCLIVRFWSNCFLVSLASKSFSFWQASTLWADLRLGHFR